MDGSGRFSTMTDSGADWLDDLPTHWGVERIKNVASVLFSNVDKHSRAEERPIRLCNYLDVYYNARIHSGLDFMEATATTEQIERFRLVAGDVLITKDSEAWNDIGVPSLVQETNGNVVCGYHLGLLRPINKVLGSYLYWSLLCREVVSQLHVRANGVTRFGLSQGAVACVRIPVPPVAEQAAIARFLDHATSRIDRYIRAKEKLIALLEEQKHVIVHETVTGRIDVRTGKRYPAYKRSGVTWVDELPEHWKVQRLGHIGRFSKGYGGTKADEINNGVPCVRYGDIYTQHRFFVHSSRACVAPDLAATTYSQIKCGDVLFAASGETIDEIGKSAANLIDGPACCGGDVIILRPSTEIDPRFLGYAADSPAAVSQKARMGRGVTVMHIYSGALKRLTVPVPPAPEQIAIGRFLDGMIVSIDSVVERSHWQINLMSELRTRLIADIVTGKRDVREAAGALPEKPRSQCTALDAGEGGDANQEEATK